MEAEVEETYMSGYQFTRLIYPAYFLDLIFFRCGLSAQFRTPGFSSDQCPVTFMSPPVEFAATLPSRSECAFKPKAGLGA